MLRPCQTLYCECEKGNCTHPGHYDARRLPMETIVAAALTIPVGNHWRTQTWRGKKVYPDVLIVSSPPPARHHTLMHPLSDHTDTHLGPANQGFLTSTGRFVDRIEAMRIVIESNQPHMAEAILKLGGTLFSEDLW